MTCESMTGRRDNQRPARPRPTAKTACAATDVSRIGVPFRCGCVTAVPGRTRFSEAAIRCCEIVNILFRQKQFDKDCLTDQPPTSATRPVCFLRVLWHQLFQRTTQCLPDADGRPEQHINFSGLDPLNIANVQVGHLRKLLLAEVFRDAFATDVVA